MKIFYFLLFLFLVFPDTTYSQEQNRSEGLIIDGRRVRPGSPEYERIREATRIAEQRRNNIPGYQYVGEADGRFKGLKMYRDERTGVVFIDNSSQTQVIRSGRGPSIPIYENGEVKFIQSSDPRYGELQRTRRNFTRAQNEWNRERARQRASNTPRRVRQQTSTNQADRSFNDNSRPNRRHTEADRRANRPEGLIIEGRHVRPESPEYEQIQRAIQIAAQRENSIPGYQYVGEKDGLMLYRHERTGVVFLDNTHHAQIIRGQRVAIIGGPHQTKVTLRGERGPSIPIYENGEIKYIKPSDPRYAELERTRRNFIRAKNEWEGERIRRRQERIRRGIAQQAPRNQERDGRRLLGTLKDFVKKSWFGKLAFFGGGLYTMLKNKTVEASELSDFTLDTLTGVFEGDRVVSSDLSVSDYLSNLKKSAEFVNANSRIFSADRQRFKTELNEIINDINDDNNLETQKKEEFLARITEIREIIQPSSPPRDPPRQRRLRSRSSARGGIR